MMVQVTWEGIEECLKGFMGYLLMYSTSPALQGTQLSLKLLTPTNIIYFVDFLLARKCTGWLRVCEHIQGPLQYIYNLPYGAHQGVNCAHTTCS